jgi:CheY-like chemotaxis protein
MAKIMTVDDSVFERRVLSDMLIKAGNTVIEADCGEKGIELYAKEKPDVVLMDLRMPGIGGGEAIKRILAGDPKAKIVVVSIVRDQETMDELIKSGAKDYVKKPVTPDKLMAAVKKAMEG